MGLRPKRRVKNREYKNKSEKRGFKIQTGSDAPNWTPGLRGEAQYPFPPTIRGCEEVNGVFGLVKEKSKPKAEGSKSTESTEIINSSKSAELAY